MNVSDAKLCSEREGERERERERDFNGYLIFYLL